MFNEKPIISKRVADMYDQKITETDDVDFMLSLIDQTPKRILEVCCGSGRILMPLAEAGHMVYGLDADTFMLGKIPEKAKGLNNIKWWQADAYNGNYGKMTLLAGEYNSDARLDTFIRRFELKLKNGETVQQDILCTKHFASLNQIHRWLSSVGFSIEQEYGDYNQNPINENSQRVIIFARKG